MHVSVPRARLAVADTQSPRRGIKAVTTDFADAALAVLQRALGPAAQFRAGQLEAIEALVEQRSRLLVVQRTGWGKSAVYFVATRLLRDRGAGTTIIVSPLLALMRDQITAASRLHLNAVTINSSNTEDWERIQQDLVRGKVDLLLVSPERFNNPEFRDRLLGPLSRSVGLLVIDEAHCISDWGHDFRPDYRRIVRVLVPTRAAATRSPTTRWSWVHSSPGRRRCRSTTRSCWPPPGSGRTNCGRR
jgi:superfamily II DNA helicase RecQ